MGLSRYNSETIQQPFSHSQDIWLLKILGGWVGGWLESGKKSCHFVVPFAILQDFKQGWNSQVGPECGKIKVFLSHLFDKL